MFCMLTVNNKSQSEIYTIQSIQGEMNLRDLILLCGKNMRIESTINSWFHCDLNVINAVNTIVLS